MKSTVMITNNPSDFEQYILNYPEDIRERLLKIRSLVKKKIKKTLKFPDKRKLFLSSYVN